MKDYDVWLVHEYFSVYFCFVADDEGEAARLISQRLDEEGLPGWIYSDAQEVKIEEMGTFPIATSVTPL